MILTKIKNKESLKLLNHINSFLFEQEYGELKNCSSNNIEIIRKARYILEKLVEYGRQ